MADGVRVEIDDPVALLTLDRPETLNALTYPMLGAFREAVLAAERDPAAVGIVITGEGRGFCSGLDASVLGATAEQGSSSRPTSDAVPGIFTWLLRRHIGSGSSPASSPTSRSARRPKRCSPRC